MEAIINSLCSDIVTLGTEMNKKLQELQQQYDALKAERDALAAQGEALRSNKISVVTECLSIVEKNKTMVGASQYWRGTDVTASKFKENIIADLRQYADRLQKGT